MSQVIELEHMHRYRLAALLAEGRDVLDIASGEGYGSAMMAKVARSVIGVDLAEDAVAHAQATYGTEVLSFRQGNATQIPLQDKAVDLAISFETIEHLTDHIGMMSELRRVLRPGGLLLISSPNKAVYSDQTDYANPFHERELYSDEFRALVSSHFSHFVHYQQKTSAASVIVSAEGDYPFRNLTPPDNMQAGLIGHRYDLLLASDGPVPDLPSSIYEWVESELQPENAELRLAELAQEIQSLGQEVESLGQEVESLALERDILVGKLHAPEAALARLAADANEILADKWWRRTRTFRRWSNSVRKLRGRPKKHWPRQFDPHAYLATAAAPGTPLASSAKEARLLSIPSFQQRVGPHLTVVTMARNEAARTHDAMRHYCALFDRVVLFDHLSEDATADIARGYDGVAGTQVLVVRGEDPGYYQSEYMSAAANALLAEGRTDWIFFLDFDEFLTFEDAATFRQALVDVANQEVVHGHWCNLALAEPAGDSLQGADALIGPRVSDFVKIALNARLVSPGVTVAQGNHAVRLPGCPTDTIGLRAFGLLHVPISGPEALQRKVTQGTKALANTNGKSENLGAHWQDMAANIDALLEDGDLAREVALQYGTPLTNLITAVSKGELTEDARHYQLRFAQTDWATPAPAAKVSSLTLQSAAETLSSLFPVASGSADAMDGLAAPLYTALSARTYPQDDPAGRPLIEDALLAASTDIEVVVPTAWLGHIPFLFSLMEVLRPRRYVELGTHAGASFFAACQHMRSNGNYGEGVAIDLWTGDHQTGLYEETVFEGFKLRLNRHFPATGRFIRGYFSEAVPCFEDGSIDLLHIDGLHTYEAVKEDYDTWRPKLTDAGVIIFHDTNEYQTDFGVWQFFEEIRNEAPVSFQFRHGHGLGVMAFGTPETNPAIALLTDFAARPEKVESFYATLSKALYDAARDRIG
ncbi:MAG: class I SAM-dependent methyltransferase [Rhodobacterales bacterium]